MDGKRIIKLMKLLYIRTIKRIVKIPIVILNLSLLSYRNFTNVELILCADDYMIGIKYLKNRRHFIHNLNTSMVNHLNLSGALSD